jgi:GT2 family glycosyltransferase
VLSIVIVNYNVKFFVEQCLFSIKMAAAYLPNVRLEVIVIDNCCTDGSMAYLKPKFQEVVFVESKSNSGFAIANNKGWQMAKGRWVLFLNPDTLITAESLTAALALFEADENIGAVGIRMVDGYGRYLPESKRGLPTAAASFYKLSGLIQLFPRSKKVAQYYMGHLNSKENHAVPVLAGACMMVKKEVLQKTGGFDEQFFMYAEDIDLSYRILQAGYTNKYLGTNTIIHFKGESTRKDAQYFRQFYLAMRQFSKKHFVAQYRWLRFYIQLAVMVRLSVYYIVSIFSNTKNSKLHQVPFSTLVVAEKEDGQEAISLIRTAKPNRERYFTIIPPASYSSEIVIGQQIDEIIFVANVSSCAYSFVISEMEKLPASFSYGFMALGSSSMVCSTGKG